MTPPLKMAEAAREISAWPRIMPRDVAARYCGYAKGHAGFDAFVHRLGVQPLRGRKGCYDKRALDAALDDESGLARTLESAEDDEWINRLMSNG